MANETENSRGYTPEEQELYDQAARTGDYQRVWKMQDERRRKEMAERESREWRTSEAGKLLKQLGEVFTAYREHLEQDPRLQNKALEFDEANQRIFDRMKTNIEKAHSVPRCKFEKANGTVCRAPRVRGKKYCHMHLMLEEARPRKISLPSLGDANGIQGPSRKARKRWWMERWIRNKRVCWGITCN